MSDYREISVAENTNPIIADLDCGEGANPDAGKDICALRDKNLNGFGEDTDKPTSYTLSLGDALTSDIDSSQGDKLEVSAVMGADSDGDDSYLIRVSGDSDWTKTDKLFFEGDVAAGESFTASEAAFGTSFGSETYVHILSSDGSTVLQTINFHTSCSAPLVIGDQYGSVSLAGAALEGKDSGAIYTVGQTETDGDAGVVYEITGGSDADDFTVDPHTGEVTFLNTPDFENPTDSDGDNKYDVEVTAFFVDAHGNKTGEVCEVKPLEVCVEDDCINILENTNPIIADLDCGEGANPDAGKDICALRDKNLNGFGEDTDKPTSYTLSLGDALTSDIDSSQGDKLEVSAVMGADSDGDDSYLIRVSGDSDWTKTDKLFFEGDVAAGESFTASEAAFGTSFGSETYVHILSSDGSTVLQTINFHTSCSAPLVIGDQYGSVSLAGAALEGKDSGAIYTVGQTETDGDAGVVYEITGGSDADDFTVDPHTGEVTFLNTPDFENPTDSDGDNKYDVEVTAFFVDAHGNKTGEVCEVKPLEVCVEDDCINILENTNPIIADLDCGEGANPDAGKDICALRDKNLNGFGEDTDKPTSYTLSLGDALTSDIDSSQGDKLEVSAVMGADSDGDDSYLIRVSGDSDWTKTDKLFFEGDVAAGESFTASEAAFGTSFGSETYVHILSSDGSTVLQTINFHTSCSAPLVIGDQYGSVSLAGAALEGKDSGAIYTVGQTETDGDAGVVYEITGGSDADDFTVDPHTGEVTFLNTPDFENPTDSDGDNKYDVEVTAFFVDAHGNKTGEVCEVKPLEVCVEDQDCIKVFENTDPGVLADLDCEEREPQNPDQGLDLCVERDALKDAGVDAGKIATVTLTLGDELTTMSSTDQGGKLEVGPILRAENGDGQLFVRVSDDKEADKTDTVYFEGAVGFGQSFTALASNAGDSEFSSETYVHIFDDDGALLQTINFHTSCSAPIAIGDQYGSVTLDGGALLNKDTNGLIEYGGSVQREVVYEITGGDGFDPTTGTSPFFDVDPETGEVTLAFTPDFENPLDDNGDNNYFVEVTGFFVNADGSREVCEVKPVEICIEDEVELGSIAGRYFCDLDGDGLDNNNGDEPAEAGVKVFLQLRDAAGNISFVADTETDANGEYVFEDLPAGEYRVIFAPVGGKVFVDPNVGQVGDVDPADDSDVIAENPVTGRGATDFIQLADGEDRTDVDAGVEFTASLGDFVFEDANADGIQDAGEAGISGVTVTLTGGGADGVIGNADDTTETTMTAADGSYLFEDLNPGEEYQVKFDQAAGFQVSPSDQGGDDTVDSDGLVSDIVTLASGEVNDTIDQGFYKTASLGDFVFEDLNGDGIQDAGEPGVENVTVELKDADGTVVATTATDAGGKYSFTGLIPGTYSVAFTPPLGFQFTDLNAGGDAARDSDADPAMGGMTQAVVLESGEFNDTLDAGLVRTASLGDFVFEDANADGIQDAGEAGISGVTVTLTGGGADGVIGNADDTTETTMTAADGSYLFEDLNPGEEYQVTFDQAAGFQVSPSDQGGDDTVDSDGLVSDIVTLASGEVNDTIDQGFYKTASLGDFVFEDLNGDGIQDAGEPGVENVTVELKDADGTVVATTATDAGGKYSFTGLIPGTYSVAFTPPLGFQFTDLNAGGDAARDSDADPAMGGMTQAVVLESGEFNDTLDAGLVRTASLGDFVFEDANADGIQDAGEAGISGVTVTLTGGGADGVIGNADDTTETTMTAADGSYLFEDLNPGEEYQVKFDQAAGFQVSPSDQGGDDTVDSDGLVSDIVTLASGEVNDTIDQGFYKTASLGDFVFEDLNGDGIQDAGEPGVENVTVELKDADGTVVATTATDAGGKYSFTGLIPGTYSVAFTPPLGFQFTDLNAGGDAARDSDADPAMGGMTQAVVLESGEFNDTLDAGLVRTASLGDFVFEDANADGIQDAGEAGISGVTVTLTGGGADGVIGNADDTTETTMTAADGSYLFEDLNPGEEYQVKFDQAAGFQVSPSDQGGDDTVDSDGLVSDIVTLASGEVNDTIDQGFYKTASLGDFVFEDLNGDGIQDAGEPGVENVTVELKDADGTVVATTATDAGGKYSFTGLIPGTYSVAFTPPLGFQFTDLNAGGDAARDSDADPAMGGMTQAVVLESGEFNDTLDAGLVRTASLGDFVFEDANADGIQDAGEAGISGVTVTLTGGGADGVIGNADDTTETTMTAADGSYLFEDLNPGEEYQVKFDQAAGFQVSPSDQGGDDTVDSDGLVSDIVTLASGEVNDTIDQGFYKTASLGDFVFEDLNGDGIQDAGEPGVENVTVELKDADGTVVATTATDAGGKYSFTGLIPGTYSVAFTPPLGFQFTDLNAGGDAARDSDADPAMGGMTQAVVLESGEFNDTLDAGLVRTASLGDFVFEDANADGIQDAGEAGISGVTVTLTGGGADGVIGNADDTTETTMTAADGSYLFEDLNPGEEYQVKFDQAAGFQVSPSDQGGDDTVDSDGLVSDIVTLASGEVNDTIDQGFYKTASLGDFVFEDLNGDGIQDAGEPGVENVTVELKDADGTVVATTATDAGGKYSFTGLIPGTYSVAFTPPLGFQFTDLNAGGDAARDSDADPAMGGMTQAVVLESGEFNDTLDAGLVADNADPNATPDSGKGCADELIKVDLSDNISDPDGDPVSITAINGVAIENGQTKQVDPDGIGGLDPVNVTLNGDTFIFDGEDAFVDLNIGDEETAQFTYTVSDGEGGEATSTIDVTFCGVAQTVAEFGDSLPTDVVFQVRDEADPISPLASDASEAFTIRLSQTGDVRFDDLVVEEAYCLSAFRSIDGGQTNDLFSNTADIPLINGTLSLLDDSSAVGGGNASSQVNPNVGAGELDNVINWILNQDFNNDPAFGGAFTNGVTDAEVQGAIWSLTDDFVFLANPGLGEEVDVEQIRDLALAQGSFEAGVGDKIGVYFDPDDGQPHKQPFVFAVDFDEFNCIC